MCLDVRQRRPRRRTTQTLCVQNQSRETLKRGVILLISVSVKETDAWEHPTDVIAMVTAQAFLGRDPLANRLREVGIELRDQVDQQEVLLLDTNGAIEAGRLVLVNMGYDEIVRSGYGPIREFGRKVLSCLSDRATDIRCMALVAQGIWQGLDEIEAFEAVLAGFLDATSVGEFPRNLERIEFCEIKQRRANRFQIALAQLFPDGTLPIPGESEVSSVQEVTRDRLRSAGYTSAGKPHVFVAMPFVEEMDDVFHYGIQSAVQSSGFICERADFSSFTGEAMAWVRQRISTASLVIADLTNANANVYLEVGYAWGRDRPTLLLARDESELLFDVRGNRCLFYKRIRDLEEALKNELNSLKTTLASSESRGLGHA